MTLNGISPPQRGSTVPRADGAAPHAPTGNVSRPAGKPGLRRREVFIHLFLVVAFLITIGMWWFVRTEEVQTTGDLFRIQAESQQFILQDRLVDDARVLKGAAGLFASHDHVNRVEWRTYVDRLALAGMLPGIQGIGFALALTPAERSAHEQAVRAEGFPQYRIFPSGDRDPLTSIIYLEPFSVRNQRAFGYDMYSEPVRREAMDRARDTGEMSLSGKVRLVQETAVERQAGSLMYIAVYRNGADSSTVAGRRASLLGFVYIPIRVTKFAWGVLSRHERQVEIELYDGLPLASNLLFSTEVGPRTAEYVLDLPLKAGGRVWTARCRSSLLFETETEPKTSTLILFGGAAVSLLLFWVLWSNTRRGRELEKLVRSRTSQLEAARDLAESSSRAKSAFLGTVSHELRTPLNSVIGFSSVLLEGHMGELAPEHRKPLSLIRSSGEQLLRLVQEILDITSIESGTLTLECTAFPLRTVLRELIETLQPQASERKLLLRCIYCDESVVVYADRHRLSQVVRNLLANAIKFTDGGFVQLRADVGGGVARIEVEDSGIGIPESEQWKVFRPFEPIERERGHLRPGTGLGLSICQRMVTAMGGTIGFDSTPGRGSRFWFTVPLAGTGG